MKGEVTAPSPTGRGCPASHCGGSERVARARDAVETGRRWGTTRPDGAPADGPCLASVPPPPRAHGLLSVRRLSSLGHSQFAEVSLSAFPINKDSEQSLNSENQKGL